MNDITYCMNQMCLDYISCRLRVQLLPRKKTFLIHRRMCSKVSERQKR